MVNIFSEGITINEFLEVLSSQRADIARVWIGTEHPIPTYIDEHVREWERSSTMRFKIRMLTLKEHTRYLLRTSRYRLETYHTTNRYQSLKPCRTPTPMLHQSFLQASTRQGNKKQSDYMHVCTARRPKHPRNGKWEPGG